MNISNLEAYVAQRNAYGKIFGQKALSLLNASDRQRIADMIDGDLSPENLLEIPRKRERTAFGTGRGERKSGKEKK